MENPIKEYHSASHLMYSCQYHVIICPKYRRKIFVNGLDEMLKENFQQTADRFHFKILEMEVMPDHVHMLIDCNPRLGIMSCISKLKNYSTQPIWEFDKTLKHRIPTVWTRSAFISSVGTVSIETVKKYIEEQKNK